MQSQAETTHKLKPAEDTDIVCLSLKLMQERLPEIRKTQLQSWLQSLQQAWSYSQASSVWQMELKSTSLHEPKTLCILDGEYEATLQGFLILQQECKFCLSTNWQKVAMHQLGMRGFLEAVHGAAVVYHRYSEATINSNT